MKVLLIAYACEPNKGSEPGVGWNWVIHLSQFVDITVVTRANNRKAIESELKNKKEKNIHFIYFDIKILSKVKRIIPYGSQIYSLLWEFFIPLRMIDENKYDLIQRVTFVSAVSFLHLYKINAPYIMSFIAGGERCPNSIFKKYSIKQKTAEVLRKIYCSTYQYLPIYRKLYDKSKLVICVTNETSQFIAASGYSGNIKIIPAIGIEEFQIGNKSFNKNFELIYAGRLIALKNICIIIDSFLKLPFNSVYLDIYGEGQERKRLQKFISSHKFNGVIKFHGNVSRSILLEKIRQSHLFVFASSHDSGGMAVLESISLGTPVLILDTGGPKEIFRDIEYPLKINAEQSYEKIVESFKDKIIWLYNNYDQFMTDYLKIRNKILERYNWNNKALDMVELYKKILDENTTST